MLGPDKRKVKLPGHPVKTGQARRGRSTELTALSISNGLLGKEISFKFCPLTSLQGGACGALAGVKQ